MSNILKLCPTHFFSGDENVIGETSPPWLRACFQSVIFGFSQIELFTERTFRASFSDFRNVFHFFFSTMREWASQVD